MDEGIKLFYKIFLKIDPDEGEVLPDNISRLEIELGRERMGFEDFLKPRLQLVSVDHFSTKEVAEEIVQKSCAPAWLKQVYMELVRCYAVIKHEGKSVGGSNKIQVYNGYPTVINPEEFAENPREVFKKGIDELIRRNKVFDIMHKPELFAKTSYWLSTEFLEQNPVYAVRKVWGFRVKEKRIGGKNGRH